MTATTAAKSPPAGAGHAPIGSALRTLIQPFLLVFVFLLVFPQIGHSGCGRSAGGCCPDEDHFDGVEQLGEKSALARTGGEGFGHVEGLRG